MSKMSRLPSHPTPRRTDQEEWSLLEQLFPKLQAFRMLFEATEHEPTIFPATLKELKQAGLKIRSLGSGYYRVAHFPAKVRVIQPSEYDPKEGMVVCQLWDDGPQQFLDNQRGVCHRCFREVRYRPHVPSEATKICIECLPKRLQN